MIIFYFVLYNIIWCVFLLINFTVIFTGYNKFNFSKGNKYWSRYHNLFDIFDILYNYHLSLFFLDWPREKFETISDRIRRYVNSKKGVRYQVAMFFAHVLNTIDKGHI